MELIHRELGGFELTELIGEGGYGQVYRAHQHALAREAVVKVLQLDLRNAQRTESFLQEARLASRLDHPYAAHVYAFGAEPDGVAWIAMELVRGTPLDRVLEHGPLPIERAVPFIQRLCEVVQTAHDQGIVHRDLKPANVMVISRAGTVFPKLIDLGIARDQLVERDGSRGGGRTGTPFYMAPEQWLDAPTAGAAADIYALGVMTYEILVGRPPFEGDTVLAIAVQHARKSPPPLPAGFPTALSEAIARAMGKRAATRFATAVELGAALVEGSGVSTDTVALPRLDEALRTDVMLHAPQPIAETVAVLDAARNPHQARLALRQVARAVAQYIGVIALACRTRSGPGRRSDRTAVFELVRTLRRDRLDVRGWWQLARELCRPFAAIQDAHPIPELVELLFAGGAPTTTAMDALVDELDDSAMASAATDQTRRALATMLPRLGAVLDSVRFLASYRLLVPGERNELYMGVRRPRRIELAADRPLAANRPVLVDADRRPVVSLWPLVQAASPSPNTPPELFLLEGGVRGAAYLVAPPNGFEHHDDALWDWLGERLGLEGSDRHPERDGAAPYRGLATFGEADADAFLGREHEVEELVNRLRTVPLIAIVGPSGVGKSSFVRAGVLPALARAGSTRGLTLRPGGAPLASLAIQLAAIGIALPAAQIADDPGRVGTRLRELAAREGVPITVVVDQFEEIFTLCPDVEQRAAYAAVLCGLARAIEEPIRVIITVRDDFLVRTSSLPLLRERLAASLHVLTTPARADLQRILVEPARRAGYTFEDGELLDEMIDDVVDRPGALALLSFTALQLWELRDRHFHQLPRKAYRALGGVGGALGRHAEQTRAGMPPEQQRLVRVAFRHLVTAEGTRAVVEEADLLAALSASASDPQVAARVVEHLVEARIIVVSEGDRGEHRIEVAHEALLTAWPRLVEWRQEDAGGIRFRDHLRAGAKQWNDRGRPSGLLWRGDALLEYQLWRSRFPDPIGALEAEFARASEDDVSRSRRLRRVALGALIALMAIASLVLWRLSRSAEAAAADAHEQLIASLFEQGRQAAVAGDTASALVYLSDAYSRGASGAALEYLLGRARRSAAGYIHAMPITAPIIPLSLRDDGTLITAATNDALWAWDAASGREVGHLPLAVPPSGDSFAAGGRLVAIPATADGKGALVWTLADGHHEVLAGDTAVVAGSITRDGTRLLLVAAHLVTVWDVTTGRLLSSLASEVALIGGVIAPAGQRIAVLTAVRTVRVFAVGDATPLEIPLPETSDLGGFDPTGTKLLTHEYSGRCAAVLWDVSGQGAAPVVMNGHRQAILNAMISRDGTRVVTGSRDRTVKVWEAASGKMLLDLTSHRAANLNVGFSADATRIVSASADRTARVWDLATGAELAVIALPDLRDAAISPDGTQVITAGDQEVKSWRVGPLDLVAELTTPSETTIPLGTAFSPDGRWIATEDRRQVVRIWDRATGRLVRELRDADLGDESNEYYGASMRKQRKLPAFDAASARLFAPAGTAIAVWDVATGARRTTLEGHRDLVSSVRVARDGRTLVSAGQDGQLRVWDAATLQPIGELHAGTAAQWFAELSPDGSLVLAAGASGVTLWRWRTGELVHTWDADHDVESAGFSPDGARVVAGDDVGVLAIWATGDGHQLARFDTGSVNMRGARFAGEDLVVTTADGLARVWDAARMVEVAHFGLAGGAVGMDRWIEVSPDDRAVATTGYDGVARVWSLASDRPQAAETAAWVRCHVPLDLVDQRIVPRPRTARDCGE